MALPKLLQKLFQNGGAGDKLNPEIVPEIKKLMLGDHVLELQEDGTLKLDENLVITSAGGTMTGGLTLAYDAPRLNLKNSKITKGVAPSSSQYTDIEFLDANGARFATITSGVHPDGSGLFGIWHASASGVQSKTLQLGIGANGNDVFAFGGKEVERVNSVSMDGGAGTGVDLQICIRYESGVQICCGETGNLQNTTQTYKMPFIKPPCVFGSIYSNDPTGRTVTTETTTTTIRVYKMSVNGGWWFAIGRWK